MRRGNFHCDGAHGRRHVVAALAGMLLVTGLVTGAAAQRIGTTPGLGGPSSGVGGGAGAMVTPPVAPAMRAISPSLTAPTLSPSLGATPTAPAVAVPAAPAASAAPATPVVVRFRCEVDPQAQSCREPGAPDGGGDDSECRCGRDYCYYTETGSQICEKQ